MPNLIEQQDLLKGLPDARLAMLLQNPIGDIPPFLVAAEAQRRQAIRQQFAGPDSKESVVDSLTKQMTGAQENIQGQTSPTPPVPATPQMQGVAALQQQQMQQAAQQGMAGGGAVQRYADRGLVTPTVQSLAAQISGMTPEELRAMDLAERMKRFEQTKKRMDITGGRYSEGELQKREDLEGRVTGPWSEFYSPESRIEAAKRLQGMPTKEEMIASLNPPKPTGGPITGNQTAGMSFTPSIEGVDTTKAGTSQENKEKTPEDQDRKRLEELFAAQEPSGWENAQKWFAMSQQFLDPSKTTMESIASAGSAFADASAAQEQARRQLELEKKKALMDYDINKKATATQNTIESIKYGAQAARSDADRAARSLDAASAALARYESSKDIMTGMPGAANKQDDPIYMSLVKAVTDAQTMLDNAQRKAAAYDKAYNEMFGTYQNPLSWDGTKLVVPGQ